MYGALRVLNINLNSGVVARYMTQDAAAMQGIRDRFLQYVKDVYVLSPEEFASMVSEECKLAHPRLFEFAKGQTYDDIVKNCAYPRGSSLYDAAACGSREADAQRRAYSYDIAVRNGHAPLWKRFFRSRGDTRALAELENVMHQPEALKTLRSELNRSNGAPKILWVFMDLHKSGTPPADFAEIVKYLKSKRSPEECLLFRDALLKEMKTGLYLRGENGQRFLTMLNKNYAQK